MRRFQRTSLTLVMALATAVACSSPSASPRGEVATSSTAPADGELDDVKTTNVDASANNVDPSATPVIQPNAGEQCAEAQEIEEANLTCQIQRLGRFWADTVDTDGFSIDDYGPDDPCKLPEGRTNPTASDIKRVTGFPLSDAGSLTPSVGTVQVVGVAVDFPDYAGTPDELDVLYSTATEFTNWLDRDSGGRTSTSWQFLDHWITLSKPAAQYHVQGFDTDAYQEISTEIVDRVLEELPLQNIDELFVYFPDSITTSELGTGVNEFDGILSQIALPRREEEQYQNSRIRHMKGSGTVSKQYGQNLSSIWAHSFLHSMGLNVHAPESLNVLDSVSTGAQTTLGWSRWLLGWYDDSQVACVTTTESPTEISLLPVETDGPQDAVRIAVVPTSETTAVVIESHRSIDGGVALLGGGFPVDYGVLAYVMDSVNVAEYDPFSFDEEEIGPRSLYPVAGGEAGATGYGDALAPGSPSEIQPLFIVGDEVVEAGIRIEFVSSADVDRIRITRQAAD